MFTENFLVPVIAAVATPGSWLALARLWVVTLAVNLLGGLVIAAIAMVALPQLHEVARTSGSHFARLGVSWRSFRSFRLAVLAGAVLTLMTRMQHASESLGLAIVPAIVMPFLLVAGQLFHSVLDSILMFAGLTAGHAPYGWLDWLGALSWSSFGNIVGGVGLVTSIRLLRVSHRVEEERDQHD